MSDILQIDQVSKRFGTFVAVDRFSLAVERGEIFGFLGPNGAGKTTTLRMVMSIIYPDEGTITVLGKRSVIDAKDRVGYLPEERGLYRKMTVESLLHYFGRLKGMSGAALTQRISDGLAQVGLSEWRKKHIEALSKGMQQKIQFLTAILHQPELVILDEPFSGLDPLNVDLMQRMILGLRDAGVTVILSTHQMETATRLCDRIVLINRGRKLIEGSLHDVRAKFSARSVLLEGEATLAPSREPPESAMHVTAGMLRCALDDGVDSAALLRTAVELTRVTRFEIQRPDLQEIFVRLVEADGDASGAAVAGGQGGD